MGSGDATAGPVNNHRVCACRPRYSEGWWVVNGGDGVESLLPACIGFAVVAVEASFGFHACGAVLGAGDAALGHLYGAFAAARSATLGNRG